MRRCGRQQDRGEDIFVDASRGSRGRTCRRALDQAEGRPLRQAPNHIVWKAIDLREDVPDRSDLLASGTKPYVVGRAWPGSSHGVPCPPHRAVRAVRDFPRKVRQPKSGKEDKRQGRLGQQQLFILLLLSHNWSSDWSRPIVYYTK